MEKRSSNQSQPSMRCNRYSLVHEFQHSGGHVNLKKLKQNGPLIVVNNSIVESARILKTSSKESSCEREGHTSRDVYINNDEDRDKFLKFNKNNVRANAIRTRSTSASLQMRPNSAAGQDVRRSH